MRKLRWFVVLTVLFAMTFTGRAGTLVQFHMYFGATTYVGDIEVELYDQDKPITVRNFLNYVNGGYFQNNFFHRCVPGFVLQGGGANIATPTSTNLFSSWTYVPTVFGTITNEFLSGTRRSNTYGTLAMARGTDLNSAASQFYFNLADNSASLDNSTNYYCVFGHVLRGTNILNVFNNIFADGGQIINMEAFYGVNTNTAFVSQLPINNGSTSQPHYVDLIYMGISTLSLQSVKLTNNTMQISWSSINGLTNNVEYTTNLPPVWQVVTNVVGTGGQMTAVDPSPIAGPRYYRIHVLY